MNNIKTKILVTLFMTATIIGGYSVFIVNTFTNKNKSSMTIANSTFRIKPGNKIDYIRSNPRNTKPGSYRTGNNTGKSMNTTVNFSGTNISSLSLKPLTDITPQTTNEVPGYSYRSLKNEKTGLDDNGLYIMSTPVLLAVNKKAGSQPSTEPLAYTTFDNGMTPDLQLAPSANNAENAGGGPGGDPFIPVGDGIGILSLLALTFAGIRFYRLQTGLK